MAHRLERAPRRTRAIGVLTLLLAAPVLAELLQAYLPDVGALLEILFFIAFMAPSYGGAALLIREVALRTGRGWPGRLLLAAVFGVLMPTFVDGSLFTPVNPDIDYWDDIMGSALVGGVSMVAVTSWVMGHVVMSVGAPLVVVESLSPPGASAPGSVGSASACWSCWERESRSRPTTTPRVAPWRRRPSATPSPSQRSCSWLRRR